MKVVRTAAFFLLCASHRSRSFTLTGKIGRAKPSESETERYESFEKRRIGEDSTNLSVLKRIFSSASFRQTKEHHDRRPNLLRRGCLVILSLFLNWALMGRVVSAESAVAAPYAAIDSAAIVPPRIAPAIPTYAPVTELQVIPRLVFAALAGSAVGWERSMSKHSAGIRTMALVSLGAAVFTVCSAYGFSSGDPARMAANVASGVGFLGAGVITTESQKKETTGVVHGLTTAAAIWLSAALGVASGVGLYLVSASTAICTIVILRLGRAKNKSSFSKSWDVPTFIEEGFEKDRETLDTTPWDEVPSQESHTIPPQTHRTLKQTQLTPARDLDILGIASNATRAFDLAESSLANATLPSEKEFIEEIFTKRKSQEHQDFVP